MNTPQLSFPFRIKQPSIIDFDGSRETAMKLWVVADMSPTHPRPNFRWSIAGSGTKPGSHILWCRPLDQTNFFYKWPLSEVWSSIILTNTTISSFKSLQSLPGYTSTNPYTGLVFAHQKTFKSLFLSLTEIEFYCWTEFHFGIFFSLPEAATKVEKRHSCCSVFFNQAKDGL